MTVYERTTKQNLDIRWTNAQKKEQHAALLGYGPEAINMAERQFTDQEIENMRMAIAQHDQKHIPAREFDLNNPPTKPYIHQEYPKMMYCSDGTYSIAQNANEEQGLIKAGYFNRPEGALLAEEQTPRDPFDVNAVPATEQEIYTREEAEKLRLENEKLRMENEQLPRGPGRPRKF